MCRETELQVLSEPADPAGGSGRNSIWKKTTPTGGRGGLAESAPGRGRVLPALAPACSPGLLGVRQQAGASLRGHPGRGAGAGTSRTPVGRSRPPGGDPASRGGRGAAWPQEELVPGFGAALDPSGTGLIGAASCRAV